MILTGSTLAGIQYLEGLGWDDQEPIHCDVKAVPGGKIVALKRVWERAYHWNPLPIDIDTARLYLGMYTHEETANIMEQKRK